MESAEHGNTENKTGIFIKKSSRKHSFWFHHRHNAGPPPQHKWTRNVRHLVSGGRMLPPHRHGFATVGSSLHPTTIVAQNALRLHQSQVSESPQFKVMCVRIITININCIPRRPQHGYSTKRPSFFSQFIDNLKQEMEKNKDMKDNIAKFREEAQKLEQSEALKTARQKFNTVESEANKGGEQLRERLDSLKDRVQDVLQEAGKSDIGKRASNLGACSREVDVFARLTAVVFVNCPQAKS